MQNYITPLQQCCCVVVVCHLYPFLISSNIHVAHMNAAWCPVVQCWVLECKYFNTQWTCTCIYYIHCTVPCALYHKWKLRCYGWGLIRWLQVQMLMLLVSININSENDIILLYMFCVIIISTCIYMYMYSPPESSLHLYVCVFVTCAQQEHYIFISL